MILCSFLKCSNEAKYFYIHNGWNENSCFARCSEHKITSPNFGESHVSIYRFISLNEFLVSKVLET